MHLVFTVKLGFFLFFPLILVSTTSRPVTISFTQKAFNHYVVVNEYVVVRNLTFEILKLEDIYIYVRKDWQNFHLGEKNLLLSACPEI